jgi:hypothetical protein
MGNHHDVTKLTEPNLNLAVRQEGNFIIIGLGLPQSSGSINQSPFTEVTRSEGTNLLNGAKSAFIEKLNGFGIDFKDIDASRGQTASGSLGAKIPKLGSGEIAVEITSEVKGGVSFRSGKVGEAVAAAQNNYDENRKIAYQDRAYEWATNGKGATAKNPATGDTFYVSPEVAKEYHNNRFWPLDPRRVDSGQQSPSGNIASADTNGFKGTDREKNFNDAKGAISTLVPADKQNDVAAAVVRNAIDAKFDPKVEIAVVPSNKNPDALIASQGNGPGALRADAVLVSQVQPGTAQHVAETLTQKNPAQQIAAVEPQAERQQQAPRTM